MTKLKDHWDQKYAETPLTQLGWYEKKPEPSIQLIENCAVSKQSKFIDVGSGASTLVANLLELGYRNLIAVDISRIALEKAKAQLTKEQAEQVSWIVDDISHPTVISKLEHITIWHDRAAFHFLREERDRQTYRELAGKVVQPGGFIVIATYAMEGASWCSGLPVERYSKESLQVFFGEEYKLIESLDHTYQMPSGDLRPYVYARFQKRR